MTDAEADQAAASIMLRLIAEQKPSIWPWQVRAEDSAQIGVAIGRIEAWLRRRAVGGDKILTRQMERPTGGKVGMSPKQARKLGVPDGTKPKP